MRVPGGGSAASANRTRTLDSYVNRRFRKPSVYAASGCTVPSCEFPRRCNNHGETSNTGRG